MTLSKSWPTILLLIIAILVCTGNLNAIDPKPLDCLADATDLTLYRWLHYEDNEGIALEDWQWQELQDLDGPNIWRGYDNGGWGVPDGIRGRWKIIGQQYGERIEIWLWAATGDDYYYLFPIADNTMRYAYSNEHWGLHPCGGFEVDKLAVLNTVAKIQDNIDLWK